jgi:hypothetical protein
MDRIKFFIGNLFGFNQEIDLLKSRIETKKIIIENKNNKEIKLNTKYNMLLNQYNQILEQPNIYDIKLPQPFEPANNIYKAGWIIINHEKNKGYTKIDYAAKNGGDHLALTPMYKDIITQANINQNDTSLEAFNKILQTIQTTTGYKYDHDQWGNGQTHHENWTPANNVWVLKNDDCESLSALVISVFEYYRLTTGKHLNSYPFIGCGIYANSYGHAFPCIYIKRTNHLEEDLWIGESTLSYKRPTRMLRDCKNTYLCNWGNHSFWHDFRIKPEYKWWNTTNNEGITMTTGKETEYKKNLVHNEKEFKKKKKLIEDFWK